MVVQNIYRRNLLHSFKTPPLAPYLSPPPHSPEPITTQTAFPQSIIIRFFEIHSIHKQGRGEIMQSNNTEATNFFPPAASTRFFQKGEMAHSQRKITTTIVFWYSYWYWYLYWYLVMMWVEQWAEQCIEQWMEEYNRTRIHKRSSPIL